MIYADHDDKDIMVELLTRKLEEERSLRIKWVRFQRSEFLLRAKQELAISVSKFTNRLCVQVFMVVSTILKII